MFNRLFFKVYLTVVGAVLLVVIVSALVWRSGPEMEVARNAFEMASGVAMAALADPGAPAPEQQKAVDRLAGLLNADIALYAADGRLLGVAGSPLPTPGEIEDGERWVWRSRGPVWSFRLPDTRVIVLRVPIEHRRGGVGFFGYLGLAAFLLAVGSYPIVRGLTRRLERLQHGVESLGAGDLSARVKVEGKDEVAKVAESFNRSAARIEELVAAHKLLLANTSHELRTPLTRLRMGVELLKQKAGPQLRAELERDIAELDELIGDILLSSRLDALHALENVEDVDLLALAAEEASRFEHTNVAGTPVTIIGDARLLRRLLTNLIENAGRHGAPPIDVEVEAAGDGAIVRVLDRGPGVADADRERIFEPFFRATVAGEKRQGAGLGLALVRQIALRHGGTIETTRTDDGRCGFVVSLPH